MEIINNRYKIIENHGENSIYSVYKATDLLNSNKNVYIKIFNYNNNKILKYFTNNFVDFTNVKHNYILENYNFSIINSIDNKQVNITRYFYTTEYFEGDRYVNFKESINSYEMLSLFSQICLTCDYLCFRGYISKDYFHPENILVKKENSKIYFKFRDVASINGGLLINNSSSYGINYFPQITRNNENINISEYIYELGKLLEYMLNSDNYNIRNENHSTNNIDFMYFHKELISLKNKMLNHDIKIRYDNFKDILKGIDSTIIIDIDNIMKESREYLNFNTRIIGRDEELSLIMKNDERLNHPSSSKTLILIDGEEGLGKTRILSEISNRLELKGRVIYKTKITKDNCTSFRSIKEILRTIIKKYENKLLDKYGAEIVKLIPELKEKYDIYPSKSLNGQKEKLRLYDRIANYISDISDKVTYIIFDDFHYADKDTFNLVNYMINYVKDYPITIIISYNSNLIDNNILYKRYLQNWIYSKDILSLKLSKFNLEETTLAMKNILGMNIKPINFATHIYRETDGNPRYIEEIMKNLFARKELFINEFGEWDYKSESYSKMYIPNNINEAIENQLKLLPVNNYKVIEKIAIFNTSISKDIIYELIDKIEKNKLNEVIDELVTMKLLEERLEDWGYTYDIYNIQTKNYIYYNLNEKERVELHKRASIILEKLYEEEGRKNIEELIYHLRMSKEYDKAIYYAINFAKAMQKLNINSQSLEIWEMAKDMLDYIEDSEYGIEIYINLGKLCNEEGLKNQAINYYKDALEISIEHNNFINIVDIKNHLSDINNRLAQYDIAIELANESKKIAKRINYVDGLLTAIILINRIDFSRGNKEKIFARSLRYLKLALEHDRYYSVAELYNQLGVISLLMGNLNDSEKYYEKSVEYYEKTDDFIEVTKPINNLGLIYGEYYGNIDKAMEYLEKGLDISKRYNSLHNTAFFYVNIGSIYIKKHKFELAKEYTHRMLNIALDIDEKNMISSAYINLSSIYIDTGELDKAWIYIHELKEQFKNGLITIDDIDKYYETLMKFYFITVQWEECNKICKEIFTRHSGEENSFYINALSINYLIRYINNIDFDNNKLYKLINLYNDSELIWDRRYYLLLWGIIALLKQDDQMVKDILKNDTHLVDKFDTDYLELMRSTLITSTCHNNIDAFVDLYKNAKNIQIPIIELILCNLIGDKFFSEKKYYYAANYYLLYIENMYKLVSSLKINEIRNNFAERFGIKKVITNLSVIIKIINGDKYSLFANKAIGPEEYFDFNRYEELFNNEDFLKTVSKQYGDSYLDEIYDIDDLVESLETDPLDNIDLIIRYAMRETLAERAIVAIYDEENDYYQTLVSKGINEFDEVQRVVDKLIQSNNSGCIKSSTEDGNNNYLINNIHENIRSMIFLPITRSNNIHNNINNNRRGKNLDYKKNIGYIYLDTEKLFNKFNLNTFDRIKKLVKLILLNVDNYRFKALSSIDKLTNVYTRKYMELAYGELYNKCIKEETCYSLLMADIDKFKNVNDTYGHQKGDLILKKVGEILRNSVRSSDIVARYGGEEFIIILPLTNKEQAYIVAEKIRKRINSENLLNEPGKITISIGISQYPIHGQFKDEIIEKADQALYNSKNTGRNKTVIWEKSLTESTKRIDKLAGIVTGNTVQDNRIVLAMVEIIELIKRDISRINKYFLMLGRLIEITESKDGSLILLNGDRSIRQIYTRERFIEDWIDKNKINEDLINRVIENKTGEYLIDWEQIDEIDSLTGNPEWHSVIVVPIISSGVVKGILQLSVPIKEKEFDYNVFNFVNVISDIASILI